MPLVPRRLDDFNEVDDDDDFEIKIRYDKGALGRRGRLLGSNIEGSLDVRIVCDGATTPSQQPSADGEKKDDPALKVQGAVVSFAPYPGYDGIAVYGHVHVVPQSGGGLHVTGAVYGLPHDAMGEWHVHAGETCANAAQVGDPMEVDDPWPGSGWQSSELGVAYIFHAVPGLSLTPDVPKTVLGKTVVVHLENGERVACGRIAPYMEGSNAPGEDKSVDESVADATGRLESSGGGGADQGVVTALAVLLVLALLCVAPACFWCGAYFRKTHKTATLATSTGGLGAGRGVSETEIGVGITPRGSAPGPPREVMSGRLLEGQESQHELQDQQTPDVEASRKLSAQLSATLAAAPPDEGSASMPAESRRATLHEITE